MRKHRITEEAYKAIEEAEKQTKEKRVSKKLQVLLLIYRGTSTVETARAVGYSQPRVSSLVAEYERDGLDEYIRQKYKGHHRSMSEAEEQEILDRFEQKANAGQIVTVQEIKKAFDERIGKDTGRGYIYMVLARHNWRKVMPRSKHPKKADEETIAASKKLRTP